MERHVDSLQRNGSEATFQVYGFGLGLGLLDTFANDLYKLALDIFQGHALHESRDVDFLGFDVIQDICKAIKRTKLRRNENMRLERSWFQRGKVEKKKKKKSFQLTSPAATYCMLATL